jgi:hypothetical protein
MVVANGVTINSGATVALRGQTTGALTQGMVIRNTSADPISGTFSNLADGAIVTINGNNLQASYEGGDGNDLTLTVVRSEFQVPKVSAQLELSKPGPRAVVSSRQSKLLRHCRESAGQQIGHLLAEQSDHCEVNQFSEQFGNG